MAELKNKTENRNVTGYDSVRVRNQSKVRFNKFLATANKKDFGGRISGCRRYGTFTCAKAK